MLQTKTSLFSASSAPLKSSGGVQGNKRLARCQTETTDNKQRHCGNGKTCRLWKHQHEAWDNLNSLWLGNNDHTPTKITKQRSKTPFSVWTTTFAFRTHNKQNRCVLENPRTQTEPKQKSAFVVAALDGQQSFCLRGETTEKNRQLWGREGCEMFPRRENLSGISSCDLQLLHDARLRRRTALMLPSLDFFHVGEWISFTRSHLAEPQRSGFTDRLV